MSEPGAPEYRLTPAGCRGQAFDRPAARVRVGRRALLTAIAAVLLLLLTAACGSGDSAETAKDFTLPSAFGSSVSLSRVLSEYDSAVLVFYRGSF